MDALILVFVGIILLEHCVQYHKHLFVLVNECKILVCLNKTKPANFDIFFVATVFRMRLLVGDIMAGYDVINDHRVYILLSVNSYYKITLIFLCI